MTKFILASVSAIALLGVAACSDTDGTTTQGVDPMLEDQTIAPAPQDPALAPPADDGIGAEPVQPIE